MLSVVNYKYDKTDIISKIKDWGYGVNWPSVYVFYNKQEAYVGETLDAVRRTEQHMAEDNFNHFSDVCFISDMAFNKSVILDLESFLIKNIAADGTKKLINGNAGIVDHNYFYREAYENEFREIWNKLIDLEIVHNSLADIGNSELYKYSPYKTLNNEQQKATYEIIKGISEINNPSKKSLIEVAGGAGTGKTILAVYLIKLLVDIKNDKKVWNEINDAEDALEVKRYTNNLNGVNKIGFIVPMKQLRNTMKTIFKSIEGLDESMVLSPQEATKSRYDILICDEAHRLYKRYHLPGSGLYTDFDNTNKLLMGDSFRGDEYDLTELDWIIKSSRMQVLFYDKNQAIRATDIGQERYEKIVNEIRYNTINLKSQMRCQGGTGYYEYIKNILFLDDYDIKNYKKFPNYELKVMDSMKELYGAIEKLNIEHGLCRITAGPNWTIEEEIKIEHDVYKWSEDKKLNPKHCYLNNEIVSIHKIQGFDLNYCAVVFGNEIVYNKKSGKIEIVREEVKDNQTKSLGDDAMRIFILNIYLALMTRGIKGTIVYALNKELNEYLKMFLN